MSVPLYSLTKLKFDNQGIDQVLRTPLSRRKNGFEFSITDAFLIVIYASFQCNVKRLFLNYHLT